MFHLNRQTAANTDIIDPASVDTTATDPASTPAKGRPTPKRRDAEQARKTALKTPADSKTARRAERERVRSERAKAREAMLAGDQRYLPARDQGPIKLFVRNFIDSRRTLGEFFVPAAILVLLAGLNRNAQIQAFVVLLWLLVMVLVVADTAILLWRMHRALKSEWPDKSDRRGVTFYAIMRNLQIRRLRVPPPMVRPGGKPVQRKK